MTFTPQRSLTIQRPLEYDPTLAARTNALSQSQRLNKSQQLNTDFGLDELDDASAATNTSGHHTHHVTELEQQLIHLRADHAALQQQLTVQTEQYTTLTATNDDNVQRIDELKKISAHSKSILINKFKQQIKSLMQTIDEQKQLLTEDEVELKALHGKAEGQTDDQVAAENNRLKSDLRTLQKQAIEYKAQIEQLKLSKADSSSSSNGVDVNNVSVMNESMMMDNGMVEQLQQEISNLKLQLQSAPAPAAATLPAAGVVQTVPVENTEHTAKYEKQIELLTAQHADAAALADTRANELAALTAKLTDAQQQYAALNDQSSNTSNESNAALNIARQHVVALENTVTELNALLAKKEAEMALVRDKAKDKLTQASDNIKILKNEYGTLRDSYKQLKAEHANAVSAQQANMTQLSGMQSGIHALKQQCGAVKQMVTGGMWDGPLMQSLVMQAIKHVQSESTQRITSLEQLYKNEMKLRRQYFNLVQELRGNIRVFVRVRPGATGETAAVTQGAEGELQVHQPDKQANTTFEFDHVFGSASTQAQVFGEVSDIVLSVLDGYNACIFAYGQTGSGKTYTMQGPVSDPGVNVRALSKLFECIEERVETWKYTVSVSLLEIYNDNIRDLLSSNADEPLKARESAAGSIEVPGLTVVHVTTSGGVLEQLKLGSKNRNVRKTDMNDVSSRSHLILSVYVTALNLMSNKEMSSKLHLIDLAGSERISRSGVTGDALKEAQNINSSLSALGNVIASRANKNAHTPYRDSSLTWLLKDSLEKNSKTLVVCQVSPAVTDVSETLCSLKFAARAREVELGKATANVKGLKLPPPSNGMKRSQSKLSDSGQ